MHSFVIQHIRRYPVRRVYWRQFYFSGVQSLAICLLAGAAIGVIMVSLMHRSFGQSSATTLNIVAVALTQEIAPIMVALLFTARSASALASELASMTVSGELRSLWRLGIPINEYLIWPRVLAAAFSCLLLYVYFCSAGVFSAVLSTTQSDILGELQQLAYHTSFNDLLFGASKSFVMGATIAALACLIGQRAAAAITEIPRLASRAVLYSVVMIFLLDALFLSLLRSANA